MIIKQKLLLIINFKLNFIIMKYQERKILEVPTLKPTINEFKNFRQYVEWIFRDNKFSDFGAVKVN